MPYERYLQCVLSGVWLTDTTTTTPSTLVFSPPSKDEYVDTRPHFIQGFPILKSPPLLERTRTQMPQARTISLWRALEDGTGDFSLTEDLLRKMIYSNINDIGGCMSRLWADSYYSNFFRSGEPEKLGMRYRRFNLQALLNASAKPGGDAGTTCKWLPTQSLQYWLLKQV